MAGHDPPKTSHRRVTKLRRAWQYFAMWPVGYYHIYYLFVTQDWRDVVRALRQLVGRLRFVVVGVSVTVIGYGLLFTLVNVAGVRSWVAYLVEGAVSVELNFFGSRYITWCDRRKQTMFWRTWVGFHAARGATLALNQGLFNLQTLVIFRKWSGFFDFTLHRWDPGFYYGFLLANTACIIVSMWVNFTANDEYVFGNGVREDDDQTQVIANRTPRVAIICPCRDSDLSGLVDALLAQHYVKRHPEMVQIVFAGNRNDKSWDSVLVPPQYQRLFRFLEILVHFTPGRDANAKRQRAILFVLKYLGDFDIIWVVDGDIEPPPDRLDRIIRRILDEGYDVVAGPVSSRTWESALFWNQYIDTAGKVPSYRHPYVLRLDTVGLQKMPVTANLAMRAGVVRKVGGPAEHFTRSFEDYEWMFRVLLNRFFILCDPELRVPREHRVGFRKLLEELVRSGKGAWQYNVEHPVQNLFRSWQLLRLCVFPVGLAVLVGACIWLPAVTLVLGTATVLSQMFGALIRAAKKFPWRQWYRASVALVFPFLGVFHRLCAVYGNVWAAYRYGRKPQPMPLVAEKFTVLAYADILLRRREAAAHARR